MVASGDTVCAVTRTPPGRARIYRLPPHREGGTELLGTPEPTTVRNSAPYSQSIPASILAT